MRPFAETSAIQSFPWGVLVGYGPMSMTIRACRGGVSPPELLMEAGRVAIRALEEVASYLELVRMPTAEIRLDAVTLPPVVRRMVESTGLVAAQELTPLAAVAGAASDAVADFLWAEGATRVIVDNGGDIAIRLGEEEEVKVGIVTGPEGGHPSHILVLRGRVGRSFGVATSGLGGRSLTKGIAQTATALARCAALADAAATIIGNATFVPHPQVWRIKASMLDPNTDIPSEMVVTRVGSLPDDVVKEALRRGLKRATSLREGECIIGAIIAVMDEVAVGPGLEDFFIISRSPSTSPTPLGSEGMGSLLPSLSTVTKEVIGCR